jgi:septal ring factor EnvC (AmiA/AmiB activator)
MKKLYTLLIILSCISLSVNAQTRKSKSSKKTTQTTKQTTPTRKQTQEILIPAGAFSVQELERQRKETLSEIETTSGLLKETSVSAKSSLNRLNLLSNQLMARKKLLAILEEEITSIDKKIKSLSGEIDNLDSELTLVKQNYAKSMQNQLQEYRSAQYKMLLILSAENFSQSYRRLRYLREYSNWQKDEANKIVKKQDEILRRKSELEKTRSEKKTLLVQREDESKKIENEEEEQQKEVNELNRKQKDLQNQIAQKKKEADALNAQIEQLIAEEIKKSEIRETKTEVAETKTASKTEPKSTKETKTETESKPAVPPKTEKTSSNNEYVMNVSEANLSKDFAGNKGKLPSPINSGYTVVSKFGENQHAELSHVRTNNNGIDMQTSSGAEARAIFKGVVSRVFIMPGYNNNVIIRHGDYLTVYSNLSQVYVKAGDIVNTQQSIGKIYSDSQKGNETILHFQLWKERTKLNPVQWIKR